MKKIVVCIVLCGLLIPLPAQTAGDPLKALVNDFVSNDWPTVLVAKEKLENTGPAAIPSIIALMNDCRLKKLDNTGDLIYPGAERFYGHGQIIDYGIDNLCVRAGWLMEELTFKNFGFSGVHLPADELSGFIKKNFPEYGNAPDHKQAASMSEEEKRILIRSLSIEKAKKWWQASAKQWNRLSALEQALYSTDERSQVKALFYLRNGKTQCKGLNQRFYKTRLAKQITLLSRSETTRVSENARLIIHDTEFEWLSIKPVN
ncbi:MAG: hypothetical protein JXQ80_05760 [Bacteroidales bacterium]|nr:hypothetical protein [Bacteroidales bacterium]